MSFAPPTRQQPVPPPAAPPRRESAVDLPTLIITAIASAVAAYTCSKIWAPGTLASAAMTPVLVALAKEALRRPTEVVTTAVPVLVPGATRRRATAGPEEPTDVVVPGGAGDLPEPAIVAVQPQPVTTYHRAPRRLHWRVAVLTGLLGFAVCAASFTVPELLNGSNGTTLFGGGTKKVQKVVTTTTETTKVVKPGKTVTETSPTETTTVPATTTAPAVTTTPTVTQTTPATTPAPPTVSTATTPTTPVTPGTTSTGADAAPVTP